MGHYYYVISAFPPISLTLRPEMTYSEARDMVRLNLSSGDWQEVVRMQRLVDIRNIRALWLREPLDTKGNFGEKELEEALLIRGELPVYLTEFMDKYETLEERLRYFTSLFSSLYQENLPLLKGFLKSYYVFEREVRLVLTALRANLAKKDLIRELQFEDPLDPFVAQLISQKDEKETVVPEEYEELKTAFLENRSEPGKLHRAIIQFRLSRIEEMEANHPFAMDQVLGHLARLAIVEEWWQLDEEQGRIMLEQICNRG